jgi:hypothetical protein
LVPPRPPLLAVAFLGALVSSPAGATADEARPKPHVVADANLSFSRFEQQVKTEVGGTRGERLVESTELGLLLTGTYVLLDYLEAGLFSQFDLGFRSSSRLAGFDGAGAAQTTAETGGAYRELWLGPLVRGRYGPIFAEVGWGALGMRWDDARDDLPSRSGDVDSALARDPAIAWLIAVGGAVPLADRLDLMLRLEYRLRYYTSRGGEPLAGGVVHGTQSFTPLVGVAYRFGTRP